MKIPTPNSSVRDIGKVVFKSKNTYFDLVQNGTREMIDLWMYNYARNIPDILDGNSVRLQSVFKNNSKSMKNHKPNNSAIVIGAGPSVYEKNHLETLANSNYKGAILCTERMLLPCLKSGITPEKFPQFFVLTIDPKAYTTKLYDDKILKKHGKDISAIMSTCTKHETIENCKKHGLNIFWFHPLIDDYTLKGAKGLLVNITGGKDLKLFEVDEVVNKIRAEVDPEAEVIIGAITSGDLDGKIRVSIVATALDGQQPESKSVINMVHRIQNRNPGYSDFNSASSAQSFNFSPTMTSPISHGANALKLENEIIAEPVTNTASSEMMNEQTATNQEVESIVENNQSNDYEQSFSEEALTTAQPEENSPIEEEHVSNGLENFGVEGEDAPDLFSSDSATSETEGFLSTETSENDDLEIPAFLRRQKN